jgi:aerobic-type carbon monoxide dehydrogenase small subunit (CoxS/CutS family)
MSEAAAFDEQSFELVVNGRHHEVAAESRLTLADCLRHVLHLTGTHLGCEHGVCGACTVLVNGNAVRSCLMLAVQARGCEITTVEGLAIGGALNPLQQAFWEKHGLQCGYCTSGILMSLTELFRDDPHPDEDAIRETLSGHLCRCTGYQNILAAALAVAAVQGEAAQ